MRFTAGLLDVIHSAWPVLAELQADSGPSRQSIQFKQSQSTDLKLPHGLVREVTPAPLQSEGEGGG